MQFLSPEPLLNINAKSSPQAINMFLFTGNPNSVPQTTKGSILLLHSELVLKAFFQFTALLHSISQWEAVIIQLLEK